MYKIFLWNLLAGELFSESHKNVFCWRQVSAQAQMFRWWFLKVSWENFYSCIDWNAADWDCNQVEVFNMFSTILRYLEKSSESWFIKVGEKKNCLSVGKICCRAKSKDLSLLLHHILYQAGPLMHCKCIHITMSSNYVTII